MRNLLKSLTSAPKTVEVGLTATSGLAHYLLHRVMTTTPKETAMTTPTIDNPDVCGEHCDFCGKDHTTARLPRARRDRWKLIYLLAWVIPSRIIGTVLAMGMGVALLIGLS
jgi:hypothetical protein